MHDADLLRDYLKNGSEAAFTELVKRYVNLVYAAARRQVGAPHLAEEITQSVFCLLARKAGALTGQTTLAGWLYRAACFQAAKVVRTEQRRQRREKEAAEMSQHDMKTDEVWESLSPVLDEGLNQLREQDRLAVLLRFFQRKPMREVGEVLGISEAAAKMRVGRAVEQLRQYLTKRGIACSSAALTVLLAEKTAKAAPETMTASISKAVLTGNAASAVSTVSLARILTLMTSTQKIWTGATIIALALMTATWHFSRTGSIQGKVDTGSAEGSAASYAPEILNGGDRPGVIGKAANSAALSPLEQAKDALRAAVHMRTKNDGVVFDEIKKALEKFGDNRKAAFEVLAKEIQDSRARDIDFPGLWDLKLWDVKDNSERSRALRKHFNEERALRGGALWAMGQIGQSVPEAAAFLWDTVRDSAGPGFDQGNALGALHTVGFTSKDLPDLTGILAEPNRVLASRFISELLRQDPAGAAAFVPEIEKLLDSPELNTRAFSAIALLQCRGTQDPRIVPAIQELFAGREDDENRLRLYKSWAVGILKDIGPSAKPLIPDLLAYAGSVTDVGAATAAYATIGAIDPGMATVVPQVALALDQQSSGEQWAQKWKSGSYTYDDLTAALKYPSQALTAAAHLGDMGSSAQSAVPQMLAALEGKDEDTRDKILENIQKIDPQVTVSKVSADIFMVGVAHATGLLATRPKTRVDQLLDSLLTRDQLRGWLTRDEVAHYVNQLAAIDLAVSQAFATGVLSADPSLQSVLPTTAGAR